MLAVKNQTLQDKICLVSGSGNVAQYTTEKLIQLGAKVVTQSDSSGYIYDEKGIDKDKLEHVMYLKNIKRGRIKEYVQKYSDAVYTDIDSSKDHNPLWDHKADCAFPSATQNEINAKDAQNLIKNNVAAVSEGANMPTTPDGVDIFLDNKILNAPGKAANAGGVAVSGLEMSQNSMRLKWSRKEVVLPIHISPSPTISMGCLSYASKNMFIPFSIAAIICSFVIASSIAKFLVPLSIFLIIRSG